MKTQDQGASVSPTGLSQVEPKEGLARSGFDPSRIGEEAVPADVRRLVIAAREVAFGPIADSVRHEPEFREHIEELDAASEAFASRVPWPGDPIIEGLKRKIADGKLESQQ